MTQEEIDALINTSKGGQAPEPPRQEEDAVVNMPDFPSFDSAESAGAKPLSPLDPKIELLYDLQLPVSIELGRTNMLIRDILRLARGSVIEFDKLASEPVDVLINGKKVAEGEVVVIDKHFGIRITTLVDPADRLRSTRR